MSLSTSQHYGWSSCCFWKCDKNSGSRCVYNGLSKRNFQLKAGTHLCKSITRSPFLKSFDGSHTTLKPKISPTSHLRVVRRGVCYQKICEGKLLHCLLWGFHPCNCIKVCCGIQKMVVIPCWWCSWSCSWWLWVCSCTEPENFAVFTCSLEIWRRAMENKSGDHQCYGSESLKGYLVLCWLQMMLSKHRY